MKMQHENQRPMPEVAMPIHKAPPIAPPEREPGFTPPKAKLPFRAPGRPMQHPSAGSES